MTCQAIGLLTELRPQGCTIQGRISNTPNVFWHIADVLFRTLALQT